MKNDSVDDFLNEYHKAADRIEYIPWMQFPGKVAEIAGVIPPCKECDHVFCQMQREHGEFVIASSDNKRR